MWVSVWHSDMFGRNDFLGEVSELSLTPISYFKVKKKSSGNIYNFCSRLKHQHDSWSKIFLHGFE